MPETCDTGFRRGGASPSAASAATLAKYILRQRRRRDTMFNPDYFADPVWDMLLDLFIARSADEEVATSSLLVAACVPPSTGLRRIRELIRDGVVTARRDPHDGRRTFVALTEQSFLAMEQWLAEFSRGLPNVGPDGRASG